MCPPARTFYLSFEMIYSIVIYFAYSLGLGFFASISNIPCSELHFTLLSHPLSPRPALPSLPSDMCLHPVAGVTPLNALCCGDGLWCFTGWSAWAAHSVLTCPPSFLIIGQAGSPSSFDLEQDVFCVYVCKQE